MREIFDRQKEFQRLVGKPVDSLKEEDRNKLSEEYILKLIEEAIEFRKEFPSYYNPYSKSQKVADLVLVKKEFADICLFLINIFNLWRFDQEDIISIIKEVQDNNFKKVYEKIQQTDTHLN